ncbi:hypothetical protein Tsubulata_017437 [Turnera subulata]|uniref:Protein EMBRYONIC FLOWER 1 n=1 Tax=Turnera subulata TaxID=218843 RepID=A0A9Q0JIG3_9ROSI|nr:hypothetical protein Tsubulata_017437 [Turnera subulata]
MESSIKIDSISIDLANVDEKINEDKCEHFSIRGYVAEIRKRDWKMCLPFLSDGDSDNYEEQTCALPPLHVPEFRYWRCQNCLQEVGAKGTASGHGEVPEPCSAGFATNAVCSHVPILSNVSKLSDFQQAAKQDVRQGKKTDANASVYLNDTTKDRPLLNTGKKEKKTEALCSPVVEKNLVPEDMNQDQNRLTGNEKEVISSPVQKTCHTNEKVAFQPQCNGSIDVSKTSYGQNKVSDAEFAGNGNCMPDTAANICDTRKETSVDNQQKELNSSSSGDTSRELNNVKEAVVEEDNINGKPSLELDDCDYLSSESAETMAGENNQVEASSGFHRRKTRKVRLLTELLCREGDGDTDSTRKGNSLASVIPDSSEEVPVVQEQVAAQGKVRRASILNRKRKLCDDEDLGHLERHSTNKISKEVRILKRDAETPDAAKTSDLEKDESAQPDFQHTVKSQCIKRKSDRGVSAVKKKRKKTVISDELGPLEPSQSNQPNEVEEKTGDAAQSENDADGQVNSVDNAFTGSEMDLFPLPTQKIDRKTYTGKMPQIDDDHISLFAPNHGPLREGSITRKDSVPMDMGPEILSFNSAEDASVEQGLSLSLNSYMDTQRCDKDLTPQVAESQTSLLSWQERSSKDEAMRKAADSRFIGNFSLNEEPAQDLVFGKGLNSEQGNERSLGRMLFHGGKQNYTSQFEIGGCSLQQKDVCSTRGDERTSGIYGRSELTRKEIHQRADKGSDPGSLDDIPMEIVELMAKNQYERRLPDAEYGKFQLELGNRAGNSQAADFSRVYGHSELSLFRQDSTQKLDLWAKTGKNGTTRSGENVGTQQKLVDYFAQADRNQLNMNQLEKTHTTAELGAFLQGDGKPQGGLQHSASLSSKQNSAQTCQWLGDVVGKRSSNANVQAPGPCNTCQSIPQQSRTANHVWSLTSHMPFVYSIPQNCAAPPTNLEMLSHSAGSTHKENVNRTSDMRFSLEGTANLAKHAGNFGSEILGRRLSEYPYSCKHNGSQLNQKPSAPVDLYSNETIPAMHLLSLMDARLRSNGPVNMDVTANLLKRPPLRHDPNLKEFSGMDTGVHKLTGTMKHGPYDYLGKNRLLENSDECIAATPRPDGTSASSLRHNKNFEKAADLSRQVSQEKERKGFDSRAQNKGGKIQKSVSKGGDFVNSCGSIPVRNTRTMLFGSNDSAVFPLPLHPLGNSTKQKLESRGTSKTVHPHRSSPQAEICSLNRNPADFCIPEGGSIYMIAGEELKFRNVLPRANVSSSAKLDGHKRQRKLPALKEHRQHLVSSFGFSIEVLAPLYILLLRMRAKL